MKVIILNDTPGLIQLTYLAQLLCVAVSYSPQTVKNTLDISITISILVSYPAIYFLIKKLDSASDYLNTKHKLF